MSKGIRYLAGFGFTTVALVMNLFFVPEPVALVLGLIISPAYLVFGWKLAGWLGELEAFQRQTRQVVAHLKEPPQSGEGVNAALLDDIAVMPVADMTTFMRQLATAMDQNPYGDPLAQHVRLTADSMDLACMQVLAGNPDTKEDH